VPFLWGADFLDKKQIFGSFPVTLLISIDTSILAVHINFKGLALDLLPRDLRLHRDRYRCLFRGGFLFRRHGHFSLQLECQNQ
jgi:hypothetical protein